MLTFVSFVFAAALVAPSELPGQSGGQLRLALRSDPKTFDPLLVEDEASEMIRYLTAGVLIRRNRLTQELEGELATKWQVSEGGRRIDFQLRNSVRFSDGTPFTCDDVVFTLRRLMDPSIHSATGDEFRTSPGNLEAKCTGPRSVTARFPGVIAALADQFDDVAIQSAHSRTRDSAVLGAFKVHEYKPGSYIELERNPNYWKIDAQGRRLPYLNSIRLDIQQNRELELLRFRRGELSLMNKIDAEMYSRLSAESPKSVVDAGPSLDWEVLFFNQASAAPIPAYKLKWFRSTSFRRAVSMAIRRDDICRIVYRGYARPAVGPVSIANRVWFNTALKPASSTPTDVLQLLASDGFRRTSDGLLDRESHKVEFSAITNSGSRVHERMLALIQQDLAAIGIKLNIVALDFSSLAERISRTFDYEACLMAFTNIDPDPNSQKNIWLSSADNHQWNPSQPKPQTEWEARIDSLVQAQTATLDLKKRKAYFDEVQQIVADQAPMIFIVNPNWLGAVSPHLKNISPAALRPQLLWNAERLYMDSTLVSQR